MLSEKTQKKCNGLVKIYKTYELSVTPMENNRTCMENDGANHYAFTKMFLQPAYLADWKLHSK
jgi:hypothetical protein